MRLNIITPIVLLVASFLAAVAHAETPTQYLVQIKLTGLAPNGGEAVLAAPRLIVLEGQNGCVHIGDTLRPPQGVTVSEPLETGASCKVKVFHKDDRLFVDATASESSGKSEPDGTELVTTGVHVIKAVTLGKKITVSAGVGITRWELLVNEFKPGDLKDSADKRPTTKRESGWKPGDLKASADRNPTTVDAAAMSNPETSSRQ